MVEEFFVKFTPFGEAKEITLTESMVREFLEVRTKTGKQATPADVRNFLELCAAQGLNPWVRDAFLVGYDLSGGGAKFNLITSQQALLKRAEFSPHFDGIEAGVIVTRAETPAEACNDNTELREGDFVFDSELLLGAWGAVYRKDKGRPFRDRLHLAVFDTKASRWEKDPAGMIVKCAEASCLRKAFPSALAGLYCQEEMEAVHAGILKEKTIYLPDGRDEQAANRIVIPGTEDLDMIDDAHRRTTPTREKVAVESRREEPREPVREDVPNEPTGPIWPEAVANLLGAIKRAKSEMALLSIRQTWIAIKANYPDAIETVENALDRRKQEVAPMGEKPKN